MQILLRWKKKELLREYINNINNLQTQLNNLVNSGLWNLKATYNNHYYLQYQTLMTWPQAKVLCEQNGGYIYCVNSQLENDNVLLCKGVCSDYVKRYK
mgnify:CR=1 FL=1